MDIGILAIILLILFVIYNLIYRGPWGRPPTDRRTRLWFGD
jgi:hypothetical protein